jgi:hypothetical protein
VNQVYNTSVTGFTSNLTVALLQPTTLQTYAGTSTFQLQSQSVLTSNAFTSIQALPSSLILQNQLYITNELSYPNQRLVIDPTQQNFTTVTSSFVTVYGSILTSTLKTSTLNVSQQISTPNLFFSTLAFYNGNAYQETRQRNSFQSFASTLVINSTLFLHNSYNVLSINVAPDPSTFMRVRSNAFFSTLSAIDLRAGTLSFSFQTL